MTAHLKYWQGYYDIGPATIPPRIRGFFLTDRGDGTVWWLTHDDLGSVKITDTLPTNRDTHVFPAFEGPPLDTAAGPVRLLIRDGYFGYELARHEEHGRRIMLKSSVTARFNTGTTDLFIEIKAPSTFTDGDELIYEDNPQL